MYTKDFVLTQIIDMQEEGLYSNTSAFTLLDMIYQGSTETDFPDTLYDDCYDYICKNGYFYNSILKIA